MTPPLGDFSSWVLWPISLKHVLLVFISVSHIRVALYWHLVCVLMALNFAHLLFNFAHEYYGCIFIISHAVFYLFRVETFLVLFSTRGKTIFVKVANSEMGTMAYHLQSFMETRLPSSQHP